ncbi:sigma-54-dependent Fis family transcriptional regulator [Roseateles saccharophilus]|uniref:Transcriptional regulator of acetoin/glycerol metabolism n=1 Tax=Roseateles saccharophilus TaxID=304 RepID=A0A4R3UIM3_ROSSA|nr:sigma-54-dependent Fis family transcriptional regulator [Roseateles saccharophilus]MDG0834732.1 sigma-54-dependent Fis family transcriptional regulator [Roseateles saccharophilus]TCU88992.1 transcriptional regulator of acetoin/glycerol metabolism [Roseateles saccharophilus]
MPTIETEAPGGAAPLAPPRQAFIERSHQRSEALGLKRHEKSGFDPLVRSDLNLARERNQRLYTHAAPVMQLLYEQIVNTESMIVLTDAQGTILHAVGDDSFLARAHRVALAPGENWAEHAKGTNAIGTALFEEAPTLVHGGEHFMHANSFLTCSASPIFDPRGNMLGVLDVTGDHRGYHQHTMGLVRMSARMIENHWLSDDYNNRLRLHFHTRPEFIGTLLEGILVVSPEGRLLGANRAALDQLGMSGAELRVRSLSSLFGTTPAAIYDHFRMPLSPPMQLSLPTGQTLFVSARFDWPSRPVVAGLHAATDTVDMPGAREPAPAVPAADAVADVALDATGAQRFSGLQYLRTGDPQLETVIQKVKRVLDRGIPLLVLGETGTGKELLARAVHHDSNRARQPFVAVNCASIPESLIEAELFGYEEGAFTGARRKGAPGRLVQANGGTLFLDEIGDMPLPLQARLLRALQERSVTPLGSTKSIAVDIAVIGATHRNLREMIAAQTFREDLYYRLNGLALRLPALRERTDIEAIVRRILQAERPQDTPELSPQVLAMFRRYQWPGNIRQLANVLRTAAVMSAGERLVTTAHLSDDFLEDIQRVVGVLTPPPAPAPMPAWPAYEAAPALPAPPPVAFATAEPATARTLGQAEIDMIRNTLDAVGGNISLASKQLGISRNTIYRKLRWNT